MHHVVSTFEDALRLWAGANLHIPAHYIQSVHLGRSTSWGGTFGEDTHQTGIIAKLVPDFARRFNDYGDGDPIIKELDYADIPLGEVIRDVTAAGTRSVWDYAEIEHQGSVIRTPLPTYEYGVWNFKLPPASKPYTFMKDASYRVTFDGLPQDLKVPSYKEASQTTLQLYR